MVWWAYPVSRPHVHYHIHDVYHINITSAISLMRWHIITMCNSNKLHLESHIISRYNHPWYSNDVGWFMINKIDKQTTDLGFYIFSRGLLEWHLVSIYYLLQHMKHEASAASKYMYPTAIKKTHYTMLFHKCQCVVDLIIEEDNRVSVMAKIRRQVVV